MDLLELHAHSTIGIVTRRLPRSPEVVDLVLSSAAEPPVGRGELVAPFRPIPTELRSWGWRAEVRLRWARPSLAPEPIVGVELAAWSTTTTELRLAPLTPHALHWGGRRWDRYFALAHAASDALVGHLTATPTALPSGPPMAAPQNWPASPSAKNEPAPAAQNKNVF
jgi:hypothetical protein